MLSRLAKLLLVATSLSPVVGAVAVNQIARGEPASSWVPWLVAAVALVALCASLLAHARRSAPLTPLRVTTFDRNHKDMLAFLVAYLLPFVSRDHLTFTGDWLTGTYILLLLFLVVAQSGALHFNPVLGLLGYRFFSVKDDKGLTHLLIARRELGRGDVDQDLAAARLAPGVHLLAEKRHA